jgi:putative membrane protein
MVEGEKSISITTEGVHHPVAVRRMQNILTCTDKLPTVRLTHTHTGGIMYFIIRLLINMVAILIIAYLVPKVIQVDSWMAALVAAFLLGVANTFIRPLLVLLTLPLTVVTFGIFLLVINGLLLWLVSTIVRGFEVNGFLGALIGAILISIVSWILSSFVRSRRT